MDRAISPLDFWGEMAIAVPELALVSRAIYLMAPSEASVERSFSAQSLLHADLRVEQATAHFFLSGSCLP